MKSNYDWITRIGPHRDHESETNFIAEHYAGEEVVNIYVLMPPRKNQKLLLKAGINDFYQFCQDYIDHIDNSRMVED